MEINKNNPLIIGKLDMSLELFYDGFQNEKNKNRYTLCDVFTGVIKKYPPTNPKIHYTDIDGIVTYKLLEVDVAVFRKDLEESSLIQNKWEKVESVSEISSLDELLELDIYKIKILNKDGVFSERILLDERLENRLRDVSSEIYLGKEFYKFVSYTYAAYIETKADVNTYEEFQEYYGKNIYAVTLEINGQTLGLTWLDFIMHPPDAHLELGSTASLGGKRFEEFNTWNKGDEITITIMSTGFKDVVLKTTMKKPPATKWTNGWYNKALKKRLEK